MKLLFVRFFSLLWFCYGCSHILAHEGAKKTSPTSKVTKAPPSSERSDPKNFLDQLKAQGFFPFYKDYITQTKKLPHKETLWKKQTIKVADAITQYARPGRAFYNNTILWYGEGTSKIGFRPVDTTTDCNSGCSPVVFHLVIDAFGSTVAILEESEPLLKKYHIPFTAADKAKLLTLAQNLPEKLSIIDHPLELTESSSKQTWTFFKDVLIKDGAYTSFVVYNAAKITRDFIGIQPTTKKSEEEEKKKLTEVFKDPVNNEKQLLALLEKIGTFLESAKHIKVKQVLLDNNLKAVYYLIMGSSQDKDLKELIVQYINPFSKDYTNYRQGFFLNFLGNLVKEEKGRKLLIALESHFKGWKDLHKGSVTFLPFLAAGLSENKAYLNQKASLVNHSEILDFASSDSFFLSCLSKAYLSLKNKKGTLQTYARLQVRFPKAQALENFKLPKAWEKELETYTNKELHNYGVFLTKEFSALGTTLPPVTGYLPYYKDKEKKLPTPTDGKQLFIFFAPWCAHCHSLLKTLGETMPPSFWKKTQLICSFSGDKKQLDKFLDLADFAKKAPLAYKEIVMLREDKSTSEYYSKELNMHAVPKMVLTNKKGIIMDFSYELEPHPEKDLNRDLEIIFSNL